MKAREKRKVSEGRDGIVCEIDCILVLSSVIFKTPRTGKKKANLCNTQVFNRGNLVPYTSQNTKTISIQLISKCSVCPFQDGHERTSKIQLAIFNWVDVGKGILDEFDGQSHCGGRCSSGRCSSTGV